jgi:predicted phage terminase large subunit-like protein
MWSGQYQQSPTPRGGAIILREYWQLWPSDTFPPCEYILASMDTAYTVKQENDASALTIWGIFRDTTGNPKVILLYAWEGRLAIHDLVLLVADICTIGGANKDEPHFPVDKLLIEAKANGISVGQELYRLYGQTGNFGIELIDPKGGDKVNRMYSIQPLFADQIIYAPARKYAEMVINNVTSFPKAAHDDIADSVSQALWYMRRTGLLLRKEEQARITHDELLFRPKEKPLY